LPLSRQYIEENGGQLVLGSEPGAGTTVAMEFPLEPGDGVEG
jgi:signal transduction histidine kinase